MAEDRIFLSFNEERHGKFTIPRCPEEDIQEIEEALLQPMYLSSGWTLWTQGSGRYTVSKVVSFETAQEFWEVWDSVPQPGELFESKMFVKESSKSGVSSVAGFMVFRDGIKPEWQDPANAGGGHFQINVKPAAGGGTLDEWWNNLVLGMIGETMECSSRINGVLLRDRTGGTTKGKALDAVRLEIWYHCSTTDEEKEALKKSLERCLLTQLDGTLGQPFKRDVITEKRH